MASDASPDFIFDQDIYYRPAANYYGYYRTGIESSSEWDDHNSFLGLDGQDHHYLAESLPYVYFTPSYGYAQSDYNPYNPFIPGAVVGVDSPFIGTQQHFTSRTYQQPVSSTPYVPIILQSTSGIVPNDTSDPLLVSPFATVSSKCDIEGAKCPLPQAPAGKAITSQRVALGNSLSETSSQQFHAPNNLSQGQVDSMPPSKQSATHGSMLPGNLPHVTQSQDRNSSGSVQATDDFLCGRVSPAQNSLIVDMSASSALKKFGSNVCKWSTIDKFRTCFQSNGFSYNGRGSSSMLNEQDWGHRTNKGRGQWTSITVKSYTTKVAVSDSQGNIIVNADQYNRDDFPVEYPDAKFFVIKSYSEDDVHRSIKYNTWSSTPSGNRRLDSAYEDAQELSAGKRKQCPVFLFFSVNASGKFCGVSEMTGPVDFHKDMNFWQKDKWTGSFPVRWHIIKDVPNSSFSHIILENNEKKPVTHSRDTQESQDRNSSGSVQATDDFLCGRVSPAQNSLIVDMSASSALKKFGSNVCKWSTIDKFRTCFQSNGFSYNGRGSSSMLNEQDWGHRTNKGRGQWTSITVKSYTTKVAVSDSQGNIIVNADQYNRDDFPVEYPDAKFFVIKSYSEDDVHRSIKYNTWSSTPSGNRRLDSAYEDAQELSACPVFLFFSVNASGKFCGVSEMTGPVDFHKDMNFWQKDKWTGSFPVRWHIIKDVPNSSFSHIILENNEKKPVTHSRDTQEIPYIPGIVMLKIFKSGPLKGSILDDFIHYEEQERVAREERSRLLRRTYNSSLFVPSFASTNICSGSANQPPAADDIQQDDIVTQFMKMDEEPVDNEIPKNDEVQMSRTVNQPLNVDGKQPIGLVKQHLTADGKDDKQPTSTVDQPRKLGGKQPDVTANELPKLNGKQLPDLADQPLTAVEKQQNSTVGCSPKADARQVNCAVSQSLKADKKQPNDGKPSDSTVSQPLKTVGKRLNGIVHHPRTTVGSPSKPDDLKIAGNMALTNEQVYLKLDAKPKPTVNPSVSGPIMRISSLSTNSKRNEGDCSNAAADFVTVGSVHIKVKDLGESSLLTFGTVPVDQQGPKLNKKS
ncbi:hypothetical protein COCNU_01G000200 [Cocos nucifera]|uniref:YTH domain-containing protein n=1 Tax=Cocos nucifera TaxID=13894 RepID=A0A8K0HSM9_COCNU|nr:hypothetical protein COCNU_01G000200 [Cocos nucifera]